MDIDQIKLDIIEYGKQMKGTGLVIGTWGNISFRHEDNIVITPSGIDYNKLKSEDMIVCDMEGKKLEGTKKPSTELSTHIAIYNKRNDVKAIIHTHSVYATAFAAARKNIPSVTEDAAMILVGEIHCAKYAFPGSEELATNVLEVLFNQNAVLLANHGAIGMGRTLEEAYLVCKILEKSARVYLLSMQVGIPKPLAIEEVEKLHNEFLNNYSKQ